MINVSDNFNEAYIPYKALLIYKAVKGDEVKHSSDSSPVYVESYDIAGNGNPINAHPLSIAESIALAELLQSSSEMQNTYLKSKGLLSQNLLFVNPDITGYAVWYTLPQQRELFFIKNLGIPCGTAFVPAMVWKASRDKLQVFALKGKSKPNAKTELCHAPFFNIYDDGAVCMGNVHINIDRNTHLEDFMAQWEKYFFGSYFSHLIGSTIRTKQNIVTLWQKQVATNGKFPDEILIPCNLKLNQLIR